MDPNQVAKKIIIGCVKKWFDEERAKRNVKKITGASLLKLIDELYDEKEQSIKKRIRKGITQNCKEESYGGEEGLKGFIEDIFQDKEFAKSRLKNELELHQATS